MHPLLFATVYGLMHAFEGDHIMAVSGLVSTKKNAFSAIKDGLLWGLGHSVTIMAFVFMVQVFAVSVHETVFTAFEALVGLMLVAIGISRIRLFFTKREEIVEPKKRVAFSTGIMHGLAGSGTLIIVLIPQNTSGLNSLLTTSLFGLGSTIGMAIASIVFFLPIYKSIHLKASHWLALATGIACMIYGLYIFGENTGIL